MQITVTIGQSAYTPDEIKAIHTIAQTVQEQKNV